MFRATRPLLRLAPGLSQPSRRHVLLRSQIHLKGLPAQTAAISPQITRRLASTRADDPPPPPKKIDHEAERKIGKQKIEARPDEVSAESSTRAIASEAVRSSSDGVEVTGGIKHDLDVVKDTFRLSAVPREPYILGLAGTLPYLATSISTFYLAWSLKKHLPTGNSLYDNLLVTHETAHHLLGVIEPIQLGYGAVIISFLGAVHWGMEYTEKKPLRERTRFRYGIGVAASIAAWPTLFMPLEYALTTQFMAFVALYFADARATVRGWAPYWYTNYRFLLTALVGFSILVSLVGRAKIDEGGRLSSQGLKDSLSQDGLADNETDWVKLEAVEREKNRKERVEAEKKAKKAAEEKKKKKAARKAKGKKSDEGEEDDDDEEDDDSEDGDDDTDSDEGQDTEESEDGDDAQENDDNGKSEDEGEDDGKDDDKDEKEKSK